MKQAGVSDAVVSAMLATEGGNRPPVYYVADPWWPDYAPWSVGLDFGFYAPYYRVYSPVHVRRVYVGGRLYRR